MNKLALITGSAKRLGAHFAISLAKLGFDIIIHYNNSEIEAEHTATQIRKEGKTCKILQYNLLDTKSFSAFFSKERSIDLLVNNASIFDPGTIKETTFELLENQFKVNVFAPFQLMAQYAQSYSTGHIINILDSDIESFHNSHAAYLLSKKSLRDLTLMAAIEFSPHIRVNAISPGPIVNANYNTSTLPSNPSIFTNNLLKSPIPISSLIAAITYLINTPSVTGQILFSDNGGHLKNTK